MDPMGYKPSSYWSTHLHGNLHMNPPETIWFADPKPRHQVNARAMCEGLEMAYNADHAQKDPSHLEDAAEGYPLVKHSHGFSMALIEIDGLPNLNMGGFSMAKSPCKGLQNELESPCLMAKSAI